MEELVLLSPALHGVCYRIWTILGHCMPIFAVMVSEVYNFRIVCEVDPCDKGLFYGHLDVDWTVPQLGIRLASLLRGWLRRKSSK